MLSRGSLPSAALPRLVLLLALASAAQVGAAAPAAPAASAASAAAAAAPRIQKQCCADLASTPGFEGPTFSVPVLILTLPAPGLPDKKDVEIVGRLCECGVGAAEEEEEDPAAGDAGGAEGAASTSGGAREDDEQPWVAVRVRGSTTARDFSKKSFALNFVPPPGQPKDKEDKGRRHLPPRFLGMPMADGKYALGGVQDDRTLGARSSITFDAFREVMGRWAPRTRRAELFVRVEPAAAAGAVPPGAAAAAAGGATTVATLSSGVAASAEIAPALLVPPASAAAASAAATAALTTFSPLLQYRGVYLASERVTRGKRRVDVANYRPPGAEEARDPTGGFLIAYENDNVRPGEPIFATRAYRLTFVVEDPSARAIANASALAAAGGPASPSSPSPDPLVYLTGFFNGLERALLAPGPLVEQIVEPAPLSLLRPPPQQQTLAPLPLEPRATLAALPALAPYLDVAAAADYFLITELTKNPDGYRGSVKMHKDAGKPLVIGTPWDYGEAYGSCCGYPLEGYKTGGRSGPGASGGSAISSNGWRFNVCADRGRCLVEPADGASQYFRRLWQDGAFRAGVAARWLRLRAGALNDAFFVAAIDASAAALGGGGAAGRNYALWAAELPARPEEMLALERAGGAAGAALPLPASASSPSSAPPLPPPAQFVAANLALRAWVLARLAWMDRALAAQADPLAPPDAYNAVAA